MELLGIVFRLAEAPGYSMQDNKLYIDRIEQHFGKYKNHELIQYTKSLVNENGIDWDAPMQIAIRLDDNMNPMADVNDVWQADGRWSKETAEKFVPLLQQFARDSEFDKFFKENTDLYNETVNRFTPIYEQVDPNWYSIFFGRESSDSFLIIIGLGNGPSPYGLSLKYADGSRTVYAIMGAWETNNEGLPVYDKPFPYFDTTTLPILLHEFNHSFVNDLTEMYKDAFRESAEKIHSILRSRSDNRAVNYPWKTMLDEALVRAAVIKYMKDHNFEQSKIDKEIKFQKEWWGFSWIDELVAELESYDRQRDIYPTLDSYMPKLAEAYKVWSENI